MFLRLILPCLDTAFRRAAFIACTVLSAVGWCCGPAEASFIDFLADAQQLPLSSTELESPADLSWMDTGAVPSSPEKDSLPRAPGAPEFTESASGMSGNPQATESNSGYPVAVPSPAGPELPLPLVVAWLQHGQLLAVPPAPRSGQCRPP